MANSSSASMVVTRTAICRVGERRRVSRVRGRCPAGTARKTRSQTSAASGRHEWPEGSLRNPLYSTVGCQVEVPYRLRHLDCWSQVDAILQQATDHTGNQFLLQTSTRATHERQRHSQIQNAVFLRLKGNSNWAHAHGKGSPTQTIEGIKNGRRCTKL